MSYITDRIMSLGSSSLVAEGLKDLNVREPGPIDWVDSKGSMPSVIQLFTGDLYKSILKNNFYSRTYEDYTRFRCPGAEEFEWTHENLENMYEYKKIVHRFSRLEEHIRKNGKFIYQCTDKDSYNTIDDTYYLLETLIPNFDTKNILILYSDKISVPSYCNSYNYSEIIAESCKTIISSALNHVNWIEFGV